MNWMHRFISDFEGRDVAGLLFENAICSMKRALSSYASTDRDSREYKYAVLHLAQSTELLMKSTLSACNKELIFRNRQDLAKGTVSTDESIKLLTRECGVRFGKEELLQIAAIKEIRNDFEHFYCPIEPQELEAILRFMISYWAGFFLRTLLPRIIPRESQVEYGLDDYFAPHEVSLIRQVDLEHRNVVAGVTAQINLFMETLSPSQREVTRVELCENCLEMALVVTPSFTKCYWCKSLSLSNGEL